MPAPTAKAVLEGVHCGVSSWRRINDNAMPARVKATANYNNGRLAGLQGKADGYDNVIILTHQGRVAESPGSCVFMVRNGVPTTPGVNNDILESITRDTVMRIFSEYFGRETAERDIDRTELYAAEETFFCGSGYEIQPILSIDRLPVGTGAVGVLTRQLQQKSSRSSAARRPTTQNGARRSISRTDKAGASLRGLADPGEERLDPLEQRPALLIEVGADAADAVGDRARLLGGAAGAGDVAGDLGGARGRLLHVAGDLRVAAPCCSTAAAIVVAVC